MKFQMDPGQGSEDFHSGACVWDKCFRLSRCEIRKLPDLELISGRPVPGHSGTISMLGQICRYNPSRTAGKDRAVGAKRYFQINSCLILKEL